MTEKPFPPRTRNPHTQARFRSETLWQIAAPLAVTGALALAAMVFFILPQGAASRSPFADVSLMLLVLQAAFCGLTLFAVLATVVWLMTYVLRELPFYAKVGQEYATLMAYKTKLYTRKVNNVVLSVRALWAGTQKTAEEVNALVKAHRPK